MVALDFASPHTTPTRVWRPDPAEPAPIFEISSLAVTLDPETRPLRLVSDVSLAVRPGECLGVVGESGCGKTVSFLSALGMMPRGSLIEGTVTLAGENLSNWSERQLESLRGRRVGMIFQDPQSALNPVLTIGRQLIEPIRLHLGLTQRQARARAVDLLGRVGIPAPESRLSAYPHQISGGMCQRVMVAMALASEPEVLIADEPTTALDATVQLQVLDLLKSIQKTSGLAIVLITHDLGVVSHICDRVAVMYAGRTVETRPVPDIFKTPWHPYTAALVDCLPRAGRSATAPRTIPGDVPMPGATPTGCAFHPRCDSASALCHKERPEIRAPHAAAGNCACHNPLRDERFRVVS